MRKTEEMGIERYFNEQEIIQSGQRAYFACVHVDEGAGIYGFLLNPEEDARGLRQILCEDCFCHNGSHVTEADAVRLGWIPKSRSMQYLISMSNDTSGGHAVRGSRSSRLGRMIFDSGITEDEVSFLCELFARGPQAGFADLTEAEEAQAQLLTDKMFKD